jgi:hypothetical protein
MKIEKQEFEKKKKSNSPEPLVKIRESIFIRMQNVYIIILNNNSLTINFHT